jgi:hypothetical protein
MGVALPSTPLPCPRDQGSVYYFLNTRGTNELNGFRHSSSDTGVALNRPARAAPLNDDRFYPVRTARELELDRASSTSRWPSGFVPSQGPRKSPNGFESSPMGISVITIWWFGASIISKPAVSCESGTMPYFAILPRSYARDPPSLWSK